MNPLSQIRYQWCVIVGLASLLVGCPFEQVDFDPYARDYLCSSDDDCLADQFCGLSEPKQDDTSESSDQDLRRICKARPVGDAQGSPPMGDVSVTDGGVDALSPDAEVNAEVDAGPMCAEATTEVCDGIDNDCDGFIDEDPLGPGSDSDTAISREDSDGDGIPGACDNCPGKANPDQLDVDANGVGDLCEDNGEDPSPRGNAYAVNECRGDMEGGAITSRNAYRNPSADACEDWAADLLSGVCTALPSSCAELQNLLETQEDRLRRRPTSFPLKTGGVGIEESRSGLCVGLPSPYFESNDQTNQDNPLAGILGWEVANRDQDLTSGQPCMQQADCPEFYRCDEGTSLCLEAVSPDVCHDGENGTLLRDERGEQLGFEEDFTSCQRSTRNRLDDMHLERTVGIRDEPLAPFSTIWAEGDLARCVLVWKKAPTEAQQRLDYLRFVRQQLDSNPLLQKPTGALKVGLHRQYHIASSPNDGAYQFDPPARLHPQYPSEIDVPSADSDPDDPNPVYKMRTETVPTIEADPDDPNFSADNIPHVVALYFGLDRPINLGCVVRNAKSLTFNFQFNVELPGACGESLEATRDRIPTLCDLERVDVDGLSLDCQGQRCTTDALNLQWVCSLRMPADILLRPECLDEDIPE